MPIKNQKSKIKNPRRGSTIAAALHDENRLEQLRSWFNEHRSAIVSYSGGVDSALVMKAAHEVLSDRALACIGVSPSYPVREMNQAVTLAEQSRFPYRLVETDEHEDERYAANPLNRCYFCKHVLYGKLRGIADREGWQVIADGTNHSDLGDDRPGRAAALEEGIRSPLVELEVSKDEVRRLARHAGLPVWDKPAMACLSSRVPHGTPITTELLRRVEKAEDVLVAHGFRQFRVRHHGDVARIELLPEDLGRAVEKRAAIVESIREAGYRFVCLDLAGFRSGLASAEGQTARLTVKGRG